MYTVMLCHHTFTKTNKRRITVIHVHNSFFSFSLHYFVGCGTKNERVVNLIATKYTASKEKDEREILKCERLCIFQLTISLFLLFHQ
jgi:hypothetical protein